MLLLSLALPAHAADVVSAGATPELNAQTFRASMDSHEFLRVVDTDLGDRGFSARGLFSYTLAPLQYTSWDGTTVDVVSDVVQFDAIGAYQVGRFRLGVDLPVILRAFGGSEADTTGLGDLALDGKVRILDPGAAPLGVAASVRTSLPTSTAEGALGASAAGVSLLASVEKPIGKSLEAVVDVGVNLQPAVELENVSWGSTAEVQAGLAWTASERAGVEAELYTAGVLSDFGNAKARPTEVLLGGWYRVGPRQGLAIHPGVAVGLNDAITSPRMRALLSVAWDPLTPPPPPDRDADGIVDASDACPDLPEDLDAYEDTDGCAELAKVTVRVVDSDGVPVEGADWSIVSAGRSGKSGDTTELLAGPVDVTSTGASVPAQIPTGGTAEVIVTVPAPRGTLSVELVDKDGKDVPSATWRAAGPTPVAASPAGSVQARPGEYHLVGEAPGYRVAKTTVNLVKDGTATLRLEMAPAKAELKKEAIEIKDSVYFETGKAVIKAESFALLDEVAEILKDHPELTKVRIEGNTDSRGDAKANQKLSQARAESVRDYFVQKGVATERLEPIGYGESKPLVKEKTAADQAKNRRVDFVVAARSDGAAPDTVKQVETGGDAPKDK